MMNLLYNFLCYFFFKLKYIFTLTFFNFMNLFKKKLILYIYMFNLNFIYQQITILKLIRIIVNLGFILSCIFTSNYYLLAISYFIYKLMSKFNKFDLLLSHMFILFMLILFILNKIHLISTLDLFIIYFFFFFFVFIYKVCFTMVMYQPHKSKNLTISWADFDKILDHLSFLIFTFIVPLSTLYLYLSILIQYPYILKCNANSGVFFNF